MTVALGSMLTIVLAMTGPGTVRAHSQLVAVRTVNSVHKSFFYLAPRITNCPVKFNATFDSPPRSVDIFNEPSVDHHGIGAEDRAVATSVENATTTSEPTEWTCPA